MNTKKNIAYVVLITACIMLFMLISSKKTSEQKTILEETQATSTTLTLVSFGDSLTAGYGVALSESYPSILEKRLQENGISVTILNMGVSGETTSMALERLNFVLQQNPDIVLLGLGANDMLRGLPPEQARANLETMVQFFQKNNTKVVLLGMEAVATNGASYRKEFNTIYPDLAKKYSLPLVPFFLDGVALNQSLNIDDGIHPNRAGYEKIVDKNILPILLPYLKKSK
jgi:acyl-CoA thioesterase-1